MRKLRYNNVIVVTVVVALLSMAVGLAILTKVKNRLVQITVESYKQQQTQLAGQIADSLSNNVMHIQNQLRVMATMPEVQDINNPEQCNAKLEELLKVNEKQLGNLARTDPTGRFACSVNKAVIGQDAVQYGSYVKDLIADPLRKPVIGRLTRPTGVDTFAVALHVPVYSGDTFNGTLGGALYFNKFQDGYLRSIKFGNSGFVVLVDDNGDILYHPSSAQNGKNLLAPDFLRTFEPQETIRQLVRDVQAGKSGNFEYSLQGTHKDGLFKTFELPGINRHWAVVVTIPTEDLEHVVNQAGINTITIILVALLTISTGLVTFVSLHNIIKNLEVQRMKDDFISITSHQLRTPATIVKQSLGLIKSGYVTSKKDVDKFIGSAYESNEDQLTIIENILNVSRLEAGRLELQKEKVIVQEIIDKVAANMKMGLNARKHKLQVTMPSRPIYLTADPTKLGMAVENLMSNAIKYTPQRGIIAINIYKRSGIVTVAVKDNGMGIAKKDIPKVFQRFNRLNSAVASHVPGTGLGLYLTKKIIELHGGTVSVESNREQGSTFIIKLPVGKDSGKNTHS